jgi:MFS family permease
MFIHGQYMTNTGVSYLIFLMFAGTLMIGGNMALVMTFVATVRNYTPPSKRGIYNGVRLIFQVMLPMIIGPFIGARIITSTDTYVDDFGVTQYVPSPEIFLGALVVAVVLFVPMIVLVKKLSTQYYD